MGQRQRHHMKLPGQWKDAYEERMEINVGGMATSSRQRTTDKPSLRHASAKHKLAAWINILPSDMQGLHICRRLGLQGCPAIFKGCW